jgi:hypothetical protein
LVNFYEHDDVISCPLETKIFLMRRTEERLCSIQLVGWLVNLFVRLFVSLLVSCNDNIDNLPLMIVTVPVCFLQPVGFVTFNTRAGAEAAKQDLQVRVVV